MNGIESINGVDGNSYMVQTASTEATAETTFDSVYTSQVEENALDEIFNRVAKETGVDVNLLKAVAQAESGFDAGAVSYCGAQGMMQLMPATAESLGVEDPFDAEQNITGGAKLLAYLLDDYNGNVSLALAAYNAGSGNVAKYGGVPPFKETVHYIEKINDLLGGALSNDSRTIDGAGATDLSGAVSSAAPNLALHGLTETTTQTVGSVTGSSSSIGENSLLSMEEYLYLLDTYEQVMERLFSAVNNQLESDSVDEGQVQRADLDTNAAIRSLDNSGTFLYNASQANVAMLAGTAMDQILQSDARSIYEAQASMISPLVERLFHK